MAFVIADRVRETTTTTGTGNLTLAGAVSKFRTFASVLSSSDTTYYSIVEQTGTAWEVGIGTFTSPSTLARTTILSSSNGGSIVTFTSGTKDVFISLPASKTNTNDQPNVIAVNSTSDALRITQIGTGNALVIEDSANPDSSPFVIDASGNVGIGTNAPAQKLDVSGNVNISGALIPSSSFLRNRIINGNMYVAQRATSATVTAGTGVPTASTGYPAADRFFAYSTGANVTAAQVSGSGSNRNLFRITGAASVTAVGVGQRIEALNSYDLAGQTCTLSVDLANSLLTTVTWTANYATTTDTFGTIGTPTKTQIATGTFTVTSTLTRYSVNISVPAAATTGVEILLTVGAQTSGTWDIGNVQFEPGSAATPFERRQYGQEFMLCQRYYQKGSSTLPGFNFCTHWLKVTMRATPTMTGTAGATITTVTVDKFRTDNGATTADFDYTASAEL